MATKIKLTLLTAFSFCLLTSANMSIASSSIKPAQRVIIAISPLNIVRAVVCIYCTSKATLKYYREKSKAKSPCTTIESSNETASPDCNCKQFSALNEFHRTKPTNN